MSTPSARHPLVEAGTAFLASPRFSHVLTLAIVGVGYLSFAGRSVLGWPGLIGAVAVLVVLAALSIVASRHQLEWQGLLPISLLVFLGWSTLSVVWSDYQWASLGSIVYQLAFASLGVYVALTRDLIQIVRSFGDVLRLVLAASLVLEVLSGILLDVPVAFLGIRGDLGVGGPIQGLEGTRNQLGLVASLALVTFVVELLTRSIPRSWAVASIVLAAMTVVFTRSPVTLGVIAIVTAAATALVALRRLEPTPRRASQFVLLGSVVVAGVVLFAARTRVIALLNAGSEFEYRYTLWRSVLAFQPANYLEGFGWLGYWRRSLPPYFAIDPAEPHASALNAFLDVFLQLGLVGLCAFIALVALALVRSWLLASNKRSVVHLWPALVLVTLLVTSAAESSILVEFAWLTLVVCTVKASQHLSWRAGLGDR